MSDPKSAQTKPLPRSESRAPVENVIGRIQSTHKTLGPISRAIADFILSQPDVVMRMSITELAEATGASQGAS